MDNLYANFGACIKEQRKLKAVTQQELALAAGLGRPTVASIEKGRQAVSLAQAAAIANALGMELADLLRAMTSPGESGRPEELQGLSKNDFEIVLELRDQMRQGSER